MKNELYKLIIDDVTNICYHNCLNYFPVKSVILDVGIGNGVMTKNYHSLIKNKDLKIIGIDINRSYLNHCDRLIRAFQLEKHINIHHQSVETYQPPQVEYFDFIVFSMSFMLFENQQLVLERIKGWLKPGGKVIFLQTMFQKRSRLMEFVKPRLKYFTTIDFGQVTYDIDFFALLEKNRLAISEDKLLKREWFKGEYRMIVTAPKNGNGHGHI